MWSYILQKAQQFERNFGIAPTVIYINPQHYEALYRENPGLFAPDLAIRLGFRLAILPGSRLSHPEAALIMPAAGAGRGPQSFMDDAGLQQDCCRDVA